MKKTSIVVVKMALLASPGFCAGSECPISGVKDIDLFYSQYASTAISPQFCLPSSTVEGNCDEAIAKRKNDFMISIVGDDLIAASTVEDVQRQISKMREDIHSQTGLEPYTVKRTKNRGQFQIIFVDKEFTKTVEERYIDDVISRLNTGIEKQAEGLFRDFLESDSEDCFVYNIASEYGEIKVSASWVDASGSSPEIMACIAKSMIGAMGISTDGNSLPGIDLLEADSSGIYGLTNTARAFLRVHYDPRVAPGALRDEASAQVRKIVAESCAN